MDDGMRIRQHPHQTTYRVELRVPLLHAPALDAQHRLDEEQVREGVAHRLLCV